MTGRRKLRCSIRVGYWSVAAISRVLTLERQLQSSGQSAHSTTFNTRSSAFNEGGYMRNTGIGMANIRRVFGMGARTALSLRSSASWSAADPLPVEAPFERDPSSHPSRVLTSIHNGLDVASGKSVHMADLAKYYFDGQGKAVRPTIVMLMGRAIYEHLASTESQTALAPMLPSRCETVAAAAEMYHTASLMHDDVIDGSTLRRGRLSAHAVFGQNAAVRGGDVVVAVANRKLAELDNPEVLICMSRIIDSLVTGELQQLSSSAKSSSSTTTNGRFERYLSKTFNKTASLMAYSCQAAASLVMADAGSRSEVGLEKAAFDFGRNVGMAFQLVDDWLDFAADEEQLGKPAGADLKLGLATAPVLFACDRFPQLETLLKRGFSGPSDVAAAVEMVRASDGMRETRMLADRYCHAAVASLNANLVDSEAKVELVGLAEKILNRAK